MFPSETMYNYCIIQIAHPIVSNKRLNELFSI